MTIAASKLVAEARERAAFWEYEPRGSEDQALYEALAARIEALEGAIRAHRDARGDDRCWMDDITLYLLLPDGLREVDLRLPPPEEMLANCRAFIACRHAGVEYVSPQREVEKLRARVAELESIELFECRACASQPGSPTLCATCRSNRRKLEGATS